MAMDIRITSGFSIEMGALFKKQLFAAIQVLLLLTQTLSSPVWMPQFLSGGQGRNIRHLPCISRRTGEQGVCMFAYTCMKSNGTHLGTCIDRFYFGSCCRLEDNNDLLLDNHLNFPQLSHNQVDVKTPATSVSSVTSVLSSLSPGGTKNNAPVKSSTASSVSSVSAVVSGGTSTLSDKTVTDATSTDKIYVPVLTSSKPNKTESSSEAAKKPTPPTTVEATTLQYFLSTFQVVHNEGDGTTTTTAPASPKITTSTTTARTTAKTTTTTRKPSKPQTTSRKPPSKKPTPKPVTKPTKKPVQTTKKPITTSKPTTTTTTTTSKPTVASKTTTPKPTTASRPTTTSTKPSSTLTTTTSTKPSSTLTTTTVAKPSSTLTTTTVAKPSSTLTTSTATTDRSTTQRIASFPETTSEVVFTKPGSSFSPPTTQFGITTFRPDLTPTTGKPILITGPGLTTFSYVSEGLKETTPRPMEVSTKPTFTSTTISNEIGTSEVVLGGISEVQEENTNVIFQQAGSTFQSSSSTSSASTSTSQGTSQPTSQKPTDTTAAFFPDSSPFQPTKAPWVEIIQSSTDGTGVTVTTTTTMTNTTGSTTTGLPMFANLNASDYTQVCGRRFYPESRVVGGEKSTFGKWPWQISLRQWRTSTYLHKCGAALLNENWAITAAHCVENVPPSDLLLRLGEHDLSTEEEPYGFQERRVQIVASHPQFDPRTFEYDLALLRFYEPVKFQPNIIPVCVPEDTTNFVGQTAYVTGWGRLYEDGPLPSVLQEVSVPVINNTLCENMYRAAGYIEHIPEIFICAGWKKGGFDSCEGDSGGPMVIQRPDKRWLLAGVISWGIGCAEPNQPGVYTRISEFREWIHQILQF